MLNSLPYWKPKQGKATQNKNRLSHFSMLFPNSTPSCSSLNSSVSNVCGSVFHILRVRLCQGLCRYTSQLQKEWLLPWSRRRCLLELCATHLCRPHMAALPTLLGHSSFLLSLTFDLDSQARIFHCQIPNSINTFQACHPWTISSVTPWSCWPLLCAWMGVESDLMGLDSSCATHSVVSKFT